MSSSNFHVEFLSRDRPLNNSATIVKLKCLKLLYSLKGMCWIDSQLKELTLNTRSSMFSGINNINFSFFGFSNLSFFVFVFATLKKENTLF